ncbi:MAG: hypothetical protein ACRDP1_04470, partial [Nocardioidaceae bacterium]
LAEAVGELAAGVRLFHDDLSRSGRFEEARVTLIEAARHATMALPGSAPLSVVATVAQTRAIAADLLYATGVTPPEIDTLLDPDENFDDEGGTLEGER